MSVLEENGKWYWECAGCGEGSREWPSIHGAKVGLKDHESECPQVMCQKLEKKLREEYEVKLNNYDQLVAQNQDLEAKNSELQKSLDLSAQKIKDLVNEVKTKNDQI